MKSKLSFLLAVGLISYHASAQNISNTSLESKNISSRGFRIGLIKPILNFEGKTTVNGQNYKVSEKLGDSIGLALGYAHIPVQGIGFTTSLAYMEIKDKDNSSVQGILRVDGNIGYSFSEFLHLKGGINLSRWTKGDASDKVKPDLGIQIGLGFQMTRNFGLDVGYTQMNQKTSNDFSDVELRESGAEIGMTATF